MKRNHRHGLRRGIATWPVIGFAALLLIGCGTTAATNNADPGGDGSQESETSANAPQESAAPDTSANVDDACDLAMSMAVDIVERQFGGSDAEEGDFTLAPGTIPTDWAAALPAAVADAACARELTWAGDTGTIVAFTIDAEELASVLDVTELEVIKDAAGAGGKVSVTLGPDALGLPIDLSEHPDQSQVEPYVLVVMQLT